MCAANTVRLEQWQSIINNMFGRSRGVEEEQIVDSDKC
jgi:hypothetical protein